MKRRAWMTMALLACLLAVAAGCSTPIPGDGTGLDGKWTGSLATLFTLFKIDLPVAVSPEASLIFDSGTLTISLQPANVFLSWLLRLEVDGSYTTDTSTALDKMTLSLGEASVKLLFFKIPVKDLATSTQCIYTIKEQNTLYILPAYDKLPDAARAALEASPETIPWDGLIIDGVTYAPIKLTRET